MDKVDVQFKKLVEWAKIPEYETKNAAGCDISLAITEEVVLYPNEVKSFPTGIAIKLPDGYEAQIRSRAGMARKGIIVANAPGTIDPEHTGEINILLLNVNDKPVKIVPGQKVAQMVISPVVQANFVQK
ncbi:dUTP pyrophosphatase [Thermosyntropha lipolytica DSM 11003]|uniref:dUTP diphosphatase n=1 Tax=Thermosyntropha lipolytica DSM 11003 TaxID=1123382 RepID=A0A1M5L5E3_9FIRM|nr:dUTP diphosphatase [Thermosyntropha lipolytica]SHG60334.1 dUTP pyrophosphatase [Thermosyntropha lipolytica DSM 11003]